MNEEEKKQRRKIANDKRKEYKRGFKEGVEHGQLVLARELRGLLGASEEGHEHPHNHPEYEELDRNW